MSQQDVATHQAPASNVGRWATWGQDALGYKTPHPFGGNDYMWHVNSVCQDGDVVCGNINTLQTSMGCRKYEVENLTDNPNVLHANGGYREKGLPSWTLKNQEWWTSKKGHGIVV